MDMMLPEYLPRERVLVAAPSVCACCSGRPFMLGEDITEAP
jgi:hypothetical protein